jgi:hypothetical protein
VTRAGRDAVTLEISAQQREGSRVRRLSLSGWTMVVFGASAGLLGAGGLVWPELTLTLLDFPVLERGQRVSGDFTLTFLTASSMAAVNMGVYYVLAALADFRAFFRWTVPFRALTFTVFCLAVLRGFAPPGFIGVAAWELLGAIATGLALAREARAG